VTQQVGQAQHHHHHGGGAAPAQPANTAQPTAPAAGGPTTLNTFA
jgi:hypothetical protein